MELWDLYTKDRALTGETHVRGKPLPEGRYHLAVHVWIRNSKGEYLVSQRAASRAAYPLMWESPGGSVAKGEDSLAGALREVKEEVGIDLAPEKGRVVFSEVRDEGAPYIMDVWLFDHDGPAGLEKATTDEVAQCRWLDAQEVKALFEAGQLVDAWEYFLAVQGWEGQA